jgi:hypothetical protein
MISANIKKVVTDAITSTAKAEKKWVLVGEAVRTDYADKAALDAVRAEFLAEVIYPAMGEEAVRVIEAVIPAKNHKDYIGASTEMRAQWDSMSEAKKDVRGKGSVNFGRVSRYAFPQSTTEAESAEADKAAKSPRGRIASRIGEAQTMIQKQEALPEHDKALLVAMAAWQTAEAATK